jgi:general L-amino acid transport system substrate-binding protein
MSRQVRSISLLLVVALLLAACAQPSAPSAEQVQVTVEVTREVPVEVTRIVEAPAEGGEPPAATAAPAQSRLEIVRARGNLVCAGRTDLVGFGYLDESGRNVGFDIDICRAVAAAIFGDGDAVEIVPVSAADRGPVIQSGEADLLSRNVTWTSTRDAQWGNFSIIMFYDGQGFMVPADSGITSALQLDGATVCVTSGTTTELNLADFFRQNGMALETVVFEDTSAVYGAYEEGRCDATTSDMSQLAAVRTGFSEPDAHILLPEVISKEPLTPAVPSGDDQWFDIVKTVLEVLINAEELGVGQGNLDEMLNSDSIEVRRLLGLEGEFGQTDLGLSPTFAQDVLRAVGNYGEIYDRYMGPEGDAFTLPRGLNNLWKNGGVIYAPPLR